MANIMRCFLDKKARISAADLLSCCQPNFADDIGTTEFDESLSKLIDIKLIEPA